MAAVPAKSHQRLHNFPLSFLKWGQRNHTSNTSNHHSCRPSTRQDSLPSQLHSHRLSEPDSDSEFENHKPQSVLGREREKVRGGGGDGLDSDFDNHNPKQRPQWVRSKREKESDDVERDGGKVRGGDVDGDGEKKPWNLRRRKAKAVTVTERERECVPAVTNPPVPKSERLRGLIEASAGEGASERREKRKLWISLGKEEIEEDIYAFTGSKPARRPKKRNKAVQKELDNLFPGLYLVGITAEAYRAHDSLK